MKRVQKSGVFFVTLFLVGTMGVFAQINQIPKQLKQFTDEVIAPFGKNDVIVRAEADQNEENLSLEEIQRRDREWRATEGVNEFMLELMSNDTALELLNLQSRYHFIVEAFVMDNKGALVGLTSKTSDYWQGDEAKFTESYAGGEGAVHYGEIEFDSSSSEIVIQVSVPVRTAVDAIGAITFGISLDRWERR